MDYEAVLTQVLALLQQEKRLSYRVLKLRLQLNDDMLEALKEDLIYAKHLAVDEEERVLVWTGDIGGIDHWFRINPAYQPTGGTGRPNLPVGSPPPEPRRPGR